MVRSALLHAPHIIDGNGVNMSGQMVYTLHAIVEELRTLNKNIERGLNEQK